MNAKQGPGEGPVSSDENSEQHTTAWVRPTPERAAAGAKKRHIRDTLRLSAHLASGGDVDFDPVGRQKPQGRRAQEQARDGYRSTYYHLRDAGTGPGIFPDWLTGDDL
jgi:hypothetical protein